MNRQLTLANHHKDLQKGDLIAVACGGIIQVGVFSQLSKKNVVRYIPINKDLSTGETSATWDNLNKCWTYNTIRPYTYERRFIVEWSRRQGSYTGYAENSSFNGSSFVPYHVDLLTEEQKVNYQKIRQFLRCSDDN